MCRQLSRSVQCALSMTPMSGRRSEKRSGSGGSDLLELDDRCPCRAEQRAFALAGVLSDHVVSKAQTHGELRGQLRGGVSNENIHRPAQDVTYLAVFSGASHAPCFIFTPSEDDDCVQ